MRALIAITALASLAACSTTTDTRMLNSNTAMVTAKGHSFASNWDVSGVALREAAQQTLDNNFSHFRIVDVSHLADSRKKSGLADPCAGDPNCRLAGSARGGNTDPDAALVVRFMTAEEAADADNVWNAQEVLASYQ